MGQVPRGPADMGHLARFRWAADYYCRQRLQCRALAQSVERSTREPNSRPAGPSELPDGPIPQIRGPRPLSDAHLRLLALGPVLLCSQLHRSPDFNLQQRNRQAGPRNPNPVIIDQPPQLVKESSLLGNSNKQNDNRR